MRILITVVVPIYNVEQYLHQCIDSICNQTHKELEIILVDDGSKDKSGNICDEYAKKDKRIIVIHKENGGLSDARNAGIEIASGEFICFIDSDDFIDKHMLENLYLSCVHNEAQISICKRRFVYDNEDTKSTCNAYSTEVFSGVEGFKHFLLEDIDGFVVAWNKLYKTNLFNNVRYPKGVIHEDCFTTYKLLLAAKTVAYIDYTGYFYRQRKGSIMNIGNFEKDYVMLSAYENILGLVKQKYPELMMAAEYRYVLTNLYVASRVADIFEIDKLQLCRRNILKMRIVNNGCFNWAQKFRTYFFISFPQMYIWIYKKVLVNIR